MKLTVIIPCYNESISIKLTRERLSRVLSKDMLKQNYEYELLFVDDGSKDDTLDVMKQLKEKDCHVKYISFSRNFGKEAAMLSRTFLFYW